MLAAWKELLERAGPEEVLALRVVGVPGSERAGHEERIETLGLKSVVTVQPWLSKETFQEQFASSSLVVFPSDFEGFGLPAVEAMRLGIPLVITPEPALLEVTAGHATVIEGHGPSALASCGGDGSSNDAGSPHGSQAARRNLHLVSLCGRRAYDAPRGDGAGAAAPTSMGAYTRASRRDLRGSNTGSWRRRGGRVRTDCPVSLCTRFTPGLDNHDRAGRAGARHGGAYRVWVDTRHSVHVAGPTPVHGISAGCAIVRVG